MSNYYKLLQKAQKERAVGGQAKLTVVSSDPKLEEQPVQLPARRDEPPVNLGHNMASIYTPVTRSLSENRGIILFVGAHSGVGTSTVTNAFSAFSTETVRHKVLLIDGNRRYPHQTSRFGVRMDYDLEDYVHGEDGIPIERAIYAIGNTGLSIASLSKVSTDRPFVPKRERLRETFEQLRNKFELVVIDCPAPTHSSEALLFAGEVDGVVMVIEADGTNQRQAQYTKALIEDNGGKVIGLVFNKRRNYLPKWLQGWL